jgi:hypothetical protein
LAQRLKLMAQISIINLRVITSAFHAGVFDVENSKFWMRMGVNASSQRKDLSDWPKMLAVPTEEQSTELPSIFLLRIVDPGFKRRA